MISKLKIGPKQHIATNDNHIIPIAINNGLPCTPLRPYDNQELLELPHAELTSDGD